MKILAKVFYVLLAFLMLALLANLLFSAWMIYPVVTQSFVLAATFAFCGASLIVVYVATVILS